MTDPRALAERLVAAFAARGAERVDCAILQPAARLLDLYGEDIRARAYVTDDPLNGEMMLRPDFTVPVTLAHMEAGRDPARYAYAGEVFRRQERAGRPSEWLQAGYELFGAHDPDQADAEVFAVLSDALAPLALRAATGDMGLIVAAVDGLSTSPARKAALRRHIWRPKRFRALLDRYAAPLPPREPVATTGPEIGRRTREEVEARLAALAEDAATPPLPPGEEMAVEAILAIQGHAGEAYDRLSRIARALPAIAPAVDRLGRRLAALETAGHRAEGLAFEGSFGRTTLEYYDGFVFGLFGAGSGPAIASGGRYDALARVLGQGRDVPAVGGAVRVGLAAEIWP